jgi:hypothetical protein
MWETADLLVFRFSAGAEVTFAVNLVLRPFYILDNSIPYRGDAPKGFLRLAALRRYRLSIGTYLAG